MHLEGGLQLKLNSPVGGDAVIYRWPLIVGVGVSATLIRPNGLLNILFPINYFFNNYKFARKIILLHYLNSFTLHLAEINIFLLCKEVNLKYK